MSKTIWAGGNPFEKNKCEVVDIPKPKEDSVYIKAFKTLPSNKALKIKPAEYKRYESSARKYAEKRGLKVRRQKEGNFFFMWFEKI